MLHDTSFYAMRSCEDNFKVPIERIGLPQFTRNDLEEQDVIGQGSFGAVYITTSETISDGAECNLRL